VTEVIIRIRNVVLLGSLMVSGAIRTWPQDVPAAEVRTPKTAEALYLQLRNVGLDKSRVYRVREGSLDRSGLHITLQDGTIAFTHDVFGHITGGFFEGDGEVLMTSPDRAERASMALFTGMAILEEQFATAYFRFNDDSYAELQPSLRPADHAEEFISQWNASALNLAESDALRLLLSFANFLPVTKSESLPLVTAPPGTGVDRMLHARLQGRTLGIFDVYFDSAASEPLWAGQTRTIEGGAFYDVWTSFSPPSGSKTEKEAEQKTDDITIVRYEIRADVKPPTVLNGDARLQVSTGRGGERALLFELSRFLQLKTVESNGRPLEFVHNQALEGSQLSRRGNDLVAVIFPEPIKPGQKLELRFVYGGDVLSEAGGGLLYVGARGTWYPNRGLAMSNFDLEFHYPLGWTLVATGKRMPLIPSSALPGNRPAEVQGEQVARWISQRPLPLAGFNLGRYVRAAAHAGDVTVESYATAGMEHNFPRAPGEVVSVPDIRKPGPFGEPPLVVTPPPPSPARNAQSVADRSARAVDVFSRYFGPYPYDALAMTQMPGKSSQGWPGLVFLSSYAFLTPDQKKQLHLSPVETIFSGQALAHEIAHQWWGDLLTWRSYRDQWMFEALANYCALMLMESESPSEFRMVMDRYRDDLLEKNKNGELLKDAGPVTLGLRLSSSHFPNGYEAISYGRGTWLFHMLRCMLRDGEAKGSRDLRSANENEPFIRSLRKLRDRYEGKVITSGDLLRVFEEDLPPALRFEGKKSLSWFLEGWINGTALPRFELLGVKYLPQSNATVVSGTLLQKEAPESLVTSVPLYAVVGGKAPVLLGRVFVDGPEANFRLTAPVGTRKILLDPYQTVMARRH